MGAEVGAQVAVVPIDWPRFLAQFPAMPFYSEFSAAGASHATEPAGPDVPFSSSTPRRPTSGWPS